jgi:hypothetical protein
MALDIVDDIVDEMVAITEQNEKDFYADLHKNPNDYKFHIKLQVLDPDYEEGDIDVEGHFYIFKYKDEIYYSHSPNNFIKIVTDDDIQQLMEKYFTKTITFLGEDNEDIGSITADDVEHKTVEITWPNKTAYMGIPYYFMKYPILSALKEAINIIRYTI